VNTIQKYKILLNVQEIQRTFDLVKSPRGYLGIDLSGLAAFMPQQRLDVSQIGVICYHILVKNGRLSKAILRDSVLSNLVSNPHFLQKLSQ
jgi:hypothetical protein